MRIVHIVPNLNSGGAEKFVVDLSNELSHIHQEVFIITLGNPNKAFFVNQLNSSVKLFGLNKGKGFSLKCIIRLLKNLILIKPDVINTHINALNYFLPLIFFFKAKKFHTIHNDAFKESSGIRRKILKIIYNLNLLIPITISNESHNSYVKAYKNEKAVLILNGVEKPELSENLNNVRNQLNQLKKNKDTKIAINIARITAQKNHLRILNVFKQLTNDNIILLIIGEKRQDELDLFLNFQSNIPENVFFLGPKKNVGDYLANSDIFILSSDFEGLPISLLEAISYGVIPICTPVGGVKDVISINDIGFLSSSVSTDGLYNAISEYLATDIDIINHKKQNCLRSYNMVYSIHQTAKNYLSVYEKQ